MDEARVSSLIAEGENESIEFKSQLDLDSAHSRAEFIKDIISLANSATTMGYMLLGVNNDKMIAGITSLDEERIQQIIRAYIDPGVSLKCSVVPMLVPGCLSVGIIEVRTTNRPHEVRKGIDTLNQGDAFIRTGSVVVRASPNDIRRMLESEATAMRETRQYSQAAEKHLQLGNLENAIAAYSEAIIRAPSAGLFLARAQVHQRHQTAGIIPKLNEKRLALGLKDCSDALELADDLDTQKAARLGRLRLCGQWNVALEDEHRSIIDYLERSWENDIEWLEEHTANVERGQFLYLREVSRLAVVVYYEDGWPKDGTIAGLTEALGLGYREPEVYYCRALAHCFTTNYGLALQDINTAINQGIKKSKLVDCLRVRAAILLEVGRFKEACIDLAKTNGWSPTEIELFGLHSEGYRLQEQIAYRIGIGIKYSLFEEQDLYRAILVGLLISRLQPAVIGPKGGEKIRLKPNLARLWPEVAPTLRAFVGDEVWRACLDEKASLVIQLAPETS